jgi:hypothetical protein
MDKSSFISTNYRAPFLLLQRSMVKSRHQASLPAKPRQSKAKAVTVTYRDINTVTGDLIILGRGLGGSISLEVLRIDNLIATTHHHQPAQPSQ